MSAQAPFLSIVIPVYNEEAILETAVSELVERLGGLTDLVPSYEILLSENGSSDRTLEVGRALQGRFPQLRVDSLGRPNYGAAMKAGILRALGTYVVCDEIDLCDVDFYRRALALLTSGQAELVVGSKAMAGAADKRPLLRRVATRTINGMLRVLVGFHGTDTHGLKAFRREALSGTARRCLVDRDLFASEFVIRAEREGKQVVEIPIQIAEKRPPSINLIKRVPNVLKNMVKLTYVIRLRG